MNRLLIALRTAALLGVLAGTGCSKAPAESMPELTRRVFSLAAGQYAQLAAQLPDGRLPRTYDEAITYADYYFLEALLRRAAADVK